MGIDKEELKKKKYPRPVTVFKQTDSQEKQATVLGTVQVSLQRLEYSLAGKLKLLLLLTAIGVAGRVAFQPFPSVEPLTPLAILAGVFLGPIYGFTAGATGFFASNFLVFGGQGPWTLFQSLGAGVAGLIGGLFSFGIVKRWKILAATILGVGAFELIVTFGGGLLFFGLLGIPLSLYFLTSLPFSIVHITSSLGFSFFSFEFREKFRRIGGRLIEQEIRIFRAIADPLSKRGYQLLPVSTRITHWKNNRKGRNRNNKGNRPEGGNNTQRPGR